MHIWCVTKIRVIMNKLYDGDKALGYKDPATKSQYDADNKQYQPNCTPLHTTQVFDKT